MASRFQPWTPLRQGLTFRVADGAHIPCTHELLNCPWSVKGTMFTSPFKILPLDYYDAILGMEWLQMFSPMNIEWKEKWLSFQYQGTQITLHGIKDTSCAAPEITVNQLLGMEKSQSIWGMVQLFNIAPDSVQQPAAIPFQIQQLVDSFQDLFAEPTGVPPIRALTHSIPLLPGAQPFRLKPYRYTPFQKDEIEKKVQHLVDSSMIQHSTSPFASPALLVKKKTGD